MFDPCEKQTKSYDELKAALKMAKVKARRYRDILQNYRGQMALQADRYREKEVAWLDELLMNGRYPRDVEERVPDAFSMVDPQRPLLKTCHEFAMQRANVYVGIRKINTQLVEVERVLSGMRDGIGGLQNCSAGGQLNVACPNFASELCGKQGKERNVRGVPCTIVHQS